MDIVKQIQDLIKQIDPAQAVLVSGILVSGLHSLLKKYKNLSKVANVVVSFVLPLAAAVLAVVVSDGSVLTRFPEVYVVAQVTYQVVQAIQRSAVTQQVVADTQGNF